MMTFLTNSGYYSQEPLHTDGASSTTLHNRQCDVKWAMHRGYMTPSKKCLEIVEIETHFLRYWHSVLSRIKAGINPKILNDQPHTDTLGSPSTPPRVSDAVAANSVQENISKGFHSYHRRVRDES